MLNSRIRYIVQNRSNICYFFLSSHCGTGGKINVCSVTICLYTAQENYTVPAAFYLKLIFLAKFDRNLTVCWTDLQSPPKEKRKWISLFSFGQNLIRLLFLNPNLRIACLPSFIPFNLWYYITQIHIILLYDTHLDFLNIISYVACNRFGSSQPFLFLSFVD